ncbi:MAG: squalene/phytoene synthase family protein [Arenicellales bacterium]|nr:squalene/phytoene synthase family protein [Arenicellales bacterium]
MPNEPLESELIPPGSTLYYAFRRLPDHQRLPCLGLFGLYRELRGLVFTQSETVYVQFGWWYKELERMLAGKPRHPLTRAISTGQPLFVTQPLDWMNRLEPLLGLSQFDDEQELFEFCVTAGAPLSTAIHTLSDIEPSGVSSINEFANDVSVAYTLFDFLQNLGKYVRDGIVPIPRSELDRSTIPASDLLKAGNTSTLIHVMQHQTNRVENTLASAYLKLPTSQVSKQYVALTITAIHKAILREIHHSHYDVMNNHIDITPLRKAWIAWNTYRKARQNRSV